MKNIILGEALQILFRYQVQIPIIIFIFKHFLMVKQLRKEAKEAYEMVIKTWQ